MVSLENFSPKFAQCGHEHHAGDDKNSEGSALSYGTKKRLPIHNTYSEF